jgi:serine/threonine-protein kinase HipA
MRVGHVEVSRWENHSFTPDPAWLEGGQRPRLGLYFLQRPQRINSTHLPLWFENLLPEKGSIPRARLASYHGLRDGQSFDLLRALGQDLPGAVRVEDEAPGPDVGAVESDRSTDDSGERPAMRFSLAGAQLKFSVALRGDTFTRLAIAADRTWIIKLASEKLPELPAVECATMAWAKSVGLPVPECRLVRVADVSGLEAFAPKGDESAFAIKRYDRGEAGVRIHQEDFAQIVHVDPLHKYGVSGPRKISLDGLAKLAADACGTGVLDALIDRIAFVVASGNNDAHLKNWSLL